MSYGKSLNLRNYKGNASQKFLRPHPLEHGQGLTYQYFRGRLNYY